MAKEYVLRVRQPDGSWFIDTTDRVPLREAKKLAQFNRCMGGIMCQIWSAEEAEAKFGQDFAGVA
jgi:hypothetical protein